MSSYVIVLALALLPAGGNLVGSLLAESVRTPPWLDGAALHASAGIAIALVSVELMPRILAATPAVVMVLAFLVGAAVSVLLIRGVKHCRKRRAPVRQPGWYSWQYSPTSPSTA